MSTNRVKLVVSYDGTDFCGWAAQTGQRAVQSTLKDAVRRVSGEDYEIVGASRTDSGAHAMGQVCHFDTAKPIPIERWRAALNRALPIDVGVRDASLVRGDFNSRFSALDRIYRYRILLGARDATRTRFAYDIDYLPDLDLMKAAARSLIGEHDFRAFTEELDKSINNTVRTLFDVSVRGTRDEIWIDIRGTAFLRGMMRRMAGGLLEVGRRYRSVEEIGMLLTPRAQELNWPVVLPARGLTLMRVRYGRHPRDNRNKESSRDGNDE